MAEDSRMLRLVFTRGWFIFPISVEVARRAEMPGEPLEVSVHFLWWHLRIYDGFTARVRKEQKDAAMG